MYGCGAGGWELSFFVLVVVLQLLFGHFVCGLTHLEDVFAMATAARLW